MTIVDLETYPIDDLASTRGGELVADARRQLADSGAFRLPGFLSENGLRRCCAEAEALEPLAHFSDHIMTPDYTPPDYGSPDGDSEAVTVRFAVGYISRDNIPSGSPFRALFEGDDFLNFLRATLPDKNLYRYSEPRGSLNVTVMRDGDEVGWHFDACELVASILFRASTSGGEFDFVPDMRAPDNDNDAGVAAVIAGQTGAMRSLPLAPGDLVLFRGRHALHRVRPVGGEVNRLIGLMSFDNVAEAPLNPANEWLFGET